MLGNPEILGQHDEMLEIIAKSQIHVFRVRTGVFVTNTFNFDMLITPGGRNTEPGDEWVDILLSDMTEPYDFPTYGVCDSVEQFCEDILPNIEKHPRTWCVALTEVRKEDQPPRDGWRWCKWGEYCGRKQPQHEYLYNEPNFESVFVFEMFVKNEKALAKTSFPQLGS